MTSAAEPEPLLISSSRKVHRYSCPSIRSYQDGRRPVERYEWEGTPQTHSDRLITWVDARFDPDANRHAYSRCETCSPDLPAWPKRVSFYRKNVAGLTLSDLGRVCDLGRLLAITYELDQGVMLTFEIDGKADVCRFHASDHVWFEQRTNRTEVERRAR